MRRCLLALIVAPALCLLAVPCAHGGDESRFNPPHLGAHLGVVVEEREEGLAVSRVLRAAFINLPGGAQLMLPVGIGDSAIRLFNGGLRLEGCGAIPDVKAPMPIPYRAGRDPILRRACALLRKQASGPLLKL